MGASFVNIGGKHFTFELANEQAATLSDNRGVIKFDQQRIIYTPGDADHMRETKLHEVLHGVEEHMGLDLEEHDVTQLSKGLYELLRDPRNRTFWREMLSETET